MVVIGGGVEWGVDRVVLPLYLYDAGGLGGVLWRGVRPKDTKAPAKGRQTERESVGWSEMLDGFLQVLV